MKVKDNERKKFEAAFKKLLKLRVNLGAVGTHAGTDLTNAELMKVHEFGVTTKTVHIPARAPIRTTFRDSGNIQRLSKNISGLILKNGVYGYSAIGNGIAETMKQMVRKTIMKRVTPPNKESTLARKKGDIPLIDTKQMVNSIEADFND